MMTLGSKAFDPNIIDKRKVAKMTIKHLRVFAAVYQEMNVTRAANRLHMTQPAVSRSIQELETHYGICLFERINHRLYQTESGKALYARALHILDSFDQLEKEMKDWDEFGILRIGGSITIGNFTLPSVVSRFQKIHPHLRLKVTVSNASNIQQAILDNQLDLALIEGTVSSEYIESRLLAEDRMCLILPPGHPLAAKPHVRLKDLIAYPLLLREPGSAGRSFLDHVFAVHQIEPEPLWESASSQALVKAVASGLGISILPEQLVTQDLRSGTVVTRVVEDESFIRKNHIIWHKQKYLTPTAREFIDFCQSEEI